MPANVEPIYSRTPDVQWAESITAANTTIDLSSGTSYLVFTADASEGGFLNEIRIKANPSANTAATVFRFWINNGGSLATPANSAIFGEMAVPATVASNSNPTPDFVYPVNKPIPPGYAIYITLGTAPGGSGEFTATAFGGKY